MFNDLLWQAEMCCEYRDKMPNKLGCDKCKTYSPNKPCKNNSYVTCYYSDKVEVCYDNYHKDIDNWALQCRRKYHYGE